MNFYLLTPRWDGHFKNGTPVRELWKEGCSQRHLVVAESGEDARKIMSERGAYGLEGPFSWLDTDVTKCFRIGTAAPGWEGSRDPHVVMSEGT